MFITVAIWLLILIAVVGAREVLELQGVNFELALTSYKYAAILFYDNTEFGRNLEDQWMDAAGNLDGMHSDAVIAKINGADPEIKELVDAYSIAIPCIKVFRRGIMADYRGPYYSKGMSAYVLEDSQPSVQIIKSLSQIKEKLRRNTKTVVLGFFDSSDMKDDDSDSYSIEPWGQFQAAADSLRGHAAFYGMSSDEKLLESFQVKHSELPVVYLISDDGDGLLPYQGEILELNLSEWVLRNSAPAMGELLLSSPTGEIYATQFFSSRKLKFILFITGLDKASQPQVLSDWQNISETFKGKALFAYMLREAVPDVLDYFAIDARRDIPLIVAHDPTKDFKFKSRPRTSLEFEALQDFVAGVLSGVAKKVIKSEKLPKARGGKDKGPVLRVVGSNVVDVVSAEGKDVLLEVFAPWCAHCKKLMPTYDILGRAVQAEERIVIAKIDGTANDLPATWGVKGYPALLWFPAKDKPYDSATGPVPRPYWDAGQSLHELVSFVQRQGSFDPKSLKIATSEQLGSLLGDEEQLRAKYLLEEQHERRNEGREQFENDLLDWAVGEVVFDGKRWHIAVAALLAAVFAISLIAMYIILVTKGSKVVAVKKKKSS